MSYSAAVLNNYQIVKNVSRHGEATKGRRSQAGVSTNNKEILLCTHPDAVNMVLFEYGFHYHI
jgi:hypothetical protein